MIKKSLPVGMIVVILLVILATMGIAYGSWTQTLTINGNASIANFAVEFLTPYGDWDNPACGTAALTNSGHDVTITFANAYPGFTCAGGVVIVNKSSIPVKINQLHVVS